VRSFCSSTSESTRPRRRPRRQRRLRRRPRRPRARPRRRRCCPPPRAAHDPRLGVHDTRSSVSDTHSSVSDTHHPTPPQDAERPAPTPSDPSVSGRAALLGLDSLPQGAAPDVMALDPADPRPQSRGGYAGAWLRNDISDLLDVPLGAMDEGADGAHLLAGALQVGPAPPSALPAPPRPCDSRGSRWFSLNVSSVFERIVRAAGDRGAAQEAREAGAPGGGSCARRERGRGRGRGRLGRERAAARVAPDDRRRGNCERSREAGPPHAQLLAKVWVGGPGRCAMR